LEPLAECKLPNRDSGSKNKQHKSSFLENAAEHAATVKSIWR